MRLVNSRQRSTKSGAFWEWGVVVGLGIMPLVAGCLKATNAPEAAAAVTAPESGEPEAQTEVADVEEDASDVLKPETSEISDAPVKPVSTEAYFPPNLNPSSSMGQIVALAQAGVEEGVMLAFVTNAASPFRLGSDEIIYLKDIGIPASVITAMLEHDQAPAADIVYADATAAFPPPAAIPAAYSPAPPISGGVPGTPAVETAYATEPIPPEPGQMEASNASFYDALAPYGTWADVEGYGRCWQPTAVVTDPGWQPYLDCGRWVYTDCGWYWMSDYSWGWAPFHYGRWFRHARLGWCWTPDTVWGPSWVCWRSTDEYCGWAPLPPEACFTVGVGLTFRGKPGKAFSDSHLRPDCFRFVPLRNFCDHHLHRHVAGHSEAVRIFKKSMAVAAITHHNRAVFNGGVPPERISVAAHTPVQTVTIRNATETSSRHFRERLEAHGTRLETVRLGSAGANSSSHDSARRVRVPTLVANNGAVSSTTAATPTITGSGTATTTPTLSPSHSASHTGTPWDPLESTCRHASLSIL